MIATRVRWLGLRARVTLTFAIAAFGLSALMAGITYFTARATFLSERQAAEQRQAFANAALVQNALSHVGLTGLLGSWLATRKSVDGVAQCP